MYLYTAFTYHDVFFLLRGGMWTLIVTVLAILIGVVLGFLIGFVRAARVPVLSQLGLAYVELFRNSPLVAQLFFVFYGLPFFLGIDVSAFQAAMWTLGVNTGAFMAVIVQAGIEAVPVGQWEAARAGGLGYWKTMRLVILPQAVRTMIPPSVNLFVQQFQVSSLIALIGFIDLTRTGQILTERTFKPFLIWTIVGAMYFAASFPLARYARHLEGRFKRVDKMA
jgi:His/Glu/Gln/Arg/opine family amino acid ABC transporter permease subunit